MSVQADNRQRDRRYAPGADQESHLHLDSTGSLLLILCLPALCLLLFSFWSNICAFFPLQPCFAEVEFPESTFVDQVELLLKDPEEKERYFQVRVTEFIHNAALNRPYESPFNLSTQSVLKGCFSHRLWARVRERSADADAGFPVQTGEASSCPRHSAGTKHSVL